MANASDLTEMMQFGDDTHDVTEAVTDVCGNFFEAVWWFQWQPWWITGSYVRTYQGRYPNRERLQVPHVTSPVPDYHLQESSHVHTFLTWCYIIWTAHLVTWLTLWRTNRRSLCLPNTRTTLSVVKANAQRIALVLQLVWTVLFPVNVQQIHVYVLALQRTARMMNKLLSLGYCLILGANIN